MRLQKYYFRQNTDLLSIKDTETYCVNVNKWLEKGRLQGGGGEHYFFSPKIYILTRQANVRSLVRVSELRACCYALSI